MKKKKLALLALLLVLSLLTACGSGAASSTAAASESEASAESAEAAPEEAAAQSQQEAEASEETAESSVSELEVTLSGEATYGANSIELNPDGMTAYPIDTTETLTFYNSFFSMNSSYSGLEENLAIQKAEELTGIHIEWMNISGMNYETNLSLMIAGGDYPDLIEKLILQYAGGMDALIEDDICIDLNPYREYAPNYYYLIDHSSLIAKDTSSDTGKRAAFRNIQSATTTPTKGMYLRNTWMEELGLEYPTTIDDYTEIFAAFKANYDQGFTFYLMSDLDSPFSYAYEVLSGTDELFYQIDGEVHYSALESGYKEYVQQMHEWYEAGYINNDFLSRDLSDTSDFKAALADGVVGCMYAGAQDLENIESTVEGYNPSTDYTPVVTPVLEDGQLIHLGVTTNVVDNGSVSISTACENIELAMRYMDFWYSEEGSILGTWGIEGETYEYDEEGRITFTDYVKNNPDVSATDMRIATTVGSAWGVLDGFSEGPMFGYDSAAVTTPAVWAGDIFDTEYEISEDVTLTAEESDEFTVIVADLETYLSENVGKFITGEKPMSEYDSFIQSIRDSFDVDRMLEIEQAAVDRYEER